MLQHGSQASSGLGDTLQDEKAVGTDRTTGQEPRLKGREKRQHKAWVGSIE